MKPDNALEFNVVPCLSDTAIQDAMNMMELNLTTKSFSLLISVSQWYLFSAAEIANDMSRTVVNLDVKVVLDHSFEGGEWSLTDLGTDSVVWCPGI